ncbi:MAG: hypothetical protein QM772_01140 [Ottowia sp.]
MRARMRSADFIHGPKDRLRDKALVVPLGQQWRREVEAQWIVPFELALDPLEEARVDIHACNLIFVLVGHQLVQPDSGIERGEMLEKVAVALGIRRVPVSDEPLATIGEDRNEQRRALRKCDHGC